MTEICQGKILLYWAISSAAALVLSPLLIGVINKIKAFFAGRRGPRLLQLYWDLAKYFRKDRLYSSTTNWIFRLAPAVSLTGILLALLLLPGGTQPSPVFFDGDVILFCYLLGMGRLLTVLAALDTGSSFAGMGAARELTFAVLAEAALLGAVGYLVLHTGSLSLSHLLIGAQLNGGQLDCTAMVLIEFALMIVLLTECCRVPVDDPETHLELTMIHEAMVLDYGSSDLALVLYGAALKLWLFASLVVLVLLPLPSVGMTGNLILHIAGVFAVAILVGVFESIMARFRLLKLPLLQAGAFGSTMLAVLLKIIFTG
ncbi:MAG: NADH-quinone oxidoreductase subunit H [Lentisphaeria bacterium]|nr:NADH-quinone oxidoreductase subunit H [Lentisphaeria bacterium]